MRVWSVLSQKGGSGKTTLVLHTAVAAMAKGLAVSIIDLDPQRSAEQWSELRAAKNNTEEPTVVHGTSARLRDMIEAARATATELVLIDTPPAIDRIMTLAAAAADLVIVPTRSGILDQFALKETLDYLRCMNMLDKAVVVLNAASADKTARDEVQRIAASDFGVPVLAVALEDRVELAEALRAGKGITEAVSRRKGAKDAAKDLGEIYRLLDVHDRRLGQARKRRTA